MMIGLFLNRSECRLFQNLPVEMERVNVLTLIIE